jgi:4-amino-4-deoxy-L-arabinose transferase-like glycosyltransferase
LEKERLIPALLLAVALSLLVGISSYEFRMEESLRVSVAWEMSKRGEYLQTYYLGEPYFNKPPLFNWLIILYSELLGWGELSLRLISVSSSVITALLIGVLSYKLLGDVFRAFLASLVFLSFSDILFWYGWLGEIDATFTLVIFASMGSLLLAFKGKRSLFVVAGLTTGLGFLMKGLPALLFFLLTALTLLLYHRRFYYTKYLLISLLISLLIPLLWLYGTEYPEMYVERLLVESLTRVESSENPQRLLLHLITYPLLNLKQTLPGSLIAILLLLKLKTLPKIREDVKPIILMLLINYLPYLFSAGSRGRYILPLLPMFAILIAHILPTEGRLYRMFVALTGILIVVRVAYGLSLGYIQEQRGSAKEIAADILSSAGDRKLACDCTEVKSVCLYINLLGDLYLKRSRLTPDWEALVECSEDRRGREAYRSYHLSGREVRLILR